MSNKGSSTPKASNDVIEPFNLTSDEELKFNLAKFNKSNEWQMDQLYQLMSNKSIDTIDTKWLQHLVATEAACKVIRFSYQKIYQEKFKEIHESMEFDEDTFSVPLTKDFYETLAA